jgi:hypothetical protein
LRGDQRHVLLLAEAVGRAYRGGASCYGHLYTGYVLKSHFTYYLTVYNAKLQVCSV